jgi:Protein of unknown function (DUF4065)
MDTRHSDLTFSFPDMDADLRLRELILYIAAKCSDDPKFNATKLNKILYFADFLSFRDHGEPITGAEYLKLEHGPAPKAMKRIQEELIQSCEIEIERRKIIDYSRNVVVAKGAANLASFTERDLKLVNMVIEELWGRTASEVSEASHGIAWQVANMQDSIPYEAALLSDEALTPDDVQWAEEQIAAYEWHVGRPDHPGK